MPSLFGNYPTNQPVTRTRRQLVNHGDTRYTRRLHALTTDSSAVYFLSRFIANPRSATSKVVVVERAVVGP